MIRLLILILLVFLGYTAYDMIRRSLGSGRGGQDQPRKSRGGEDMVRDPNCGTYIPLSDALSARINGKEHHFCSKACRDAYKKR